jgi:phage host-nuclease inhibitor protein Gam
LKCPNFKISKIKNVKYKKNNLVRFFTEYSKCHNDELISFEPKQKRDVFNSTVRPRLNSFSLTIVNSYYNPRIIAFGNKMGFGSGLEAEFILPYNKKNRQL